MRLQDLGGASGVGTTKGSEISNYTVNGVLGFSGTVSLEGIFLEQPIALTQSAPILAAADGTSSTYGFFDYPITNYQELLANASFIFAGLNGSGFPVLDLASDPSIQITDSSGHLLPTYQFSGATETVGSVSVVSFTTPELSTIRMFASGGVVLFFVFLGRRRDSKLCLTTLTPS